uniref:Ribosomal protein S4 n=1 Tax=Nephroselmis olivacea TaxID=31312 RepID=Q9TCC4_NEPOL|nr:ribosomal protein S4 [Nephroselmis olivacea]AAF03172.1 ribosomal protein S4 [Nephroselmis olivacea]
MQKKPLFKTCKHLFFHIRPTKKLNSKQSTILKHLILWKMARIKKKTQLPLSPSFKLWQRSSTLPKTASLHIKRVQKNEQKESDYFSQFTTRQTLSSIYGNIQKKQMNNLVNQAFRRKGHAGSRLITLLESRLDVILYRASFCTSIFTARQLINHNKIMVNGIISNSSALLLSPGDIVSVVHNYEMTLKNSIKSIQKKNLNKPNYLEISYNLMTIVFLYAPTYVFFQTYIDRDNIHKSF